MEQRWESKEIQSVLDCV